MKLGVFGGTFDPIHLGHMAIAEEARRAVGLDEVLFIPAGSPWLKSGQRISDARHRMAMAQRAVAPVPYFRCSDIEINRPGPTYTVDTLEGLVEELGQRPDSHSWKLHVQQQKAESTVWSRFRVGSNEQCVVFRDFGAASPHFLARDDQLTTVNTRLGLDGGKI